MCYHCYMKTIRIDEELYERLKVGAFHDGRSLIRYVDRKLRNATDNVDTTAYKGGRMFPISPAYQIDEKTIKELANHGPIITIPKEELKPLEQPKLPPMRPKQEIMNDIRAIEKQRDEDLLYCQDQETKDKINRYAKEQLDDLWAEYNDNVTRAMDS